MTMESFQNPFKILALLSLWVLCHAGTGLRQDPRNEFYNHAVVQPILYRTSSFRRDLPLLKDVQDEKMKLEFEAFGKSFVVNLKENKLLFTPDYKEIYQENGTFVAYKPSNNKEKRCFYNGHIQDVRGSWAAVSTCNGISGVISDGKEAYFIEPNHISEEIEHLVFKSSDYKQHDLKCGVGNENIFSMRSSFKELEVQSVEDPYKSNNESRYIELIVVNDKSMYDKYNGNLQAIFDRTSQLVNVASSILSRLNTFLALQNIFVWSQGDSITFTSDAEGTLKHFLDYRRNVINPRDPNDNAILITNNRYDRNVVGNAFVGGICSATKSGENIVDTSSVVGLVASNAAHELGHNLGMTHDNSKYCTCPDSFCVMHAYTLSSIPLHWSSCSKLDIEYTYSSGKDRCLRNKPTKISGPSCGNGYLEYGEECDCGIKEFCDDNCCDATTCRKTCF